MDRIPKPGECYRHFKNKLYQIIAVAAHSETGERLVVYQALYGTFGVYARPLTMFLSEVDHDKYPDVVQKYRFEKVELRSEEDGFAETAVQVPDHRETIQQPGMEIHGVKEADGRQVSAQDDSANLLAFLEADNYVSRLEILRSRKSSFKLRELEGICEVMEISDSSATVEEKYYAVERFLKVQAKYDGTRLR